MENLKEIVKMPNDIHREKIIDVLESMPGDDALEIIAQAINNVDMTRARCLWLIRNLDADQRDELLFAAAEWLDGDASKDYADDTEG